MRIFDRQVCNIFCFSVPYEAVNSTEGIFFPDISKGLRAAFVVHLNQALFAESGIGRGGCPGGLEDHSRTQRGAGQDSAIQLSAGKATPLTAAPPDISMAPTAKAPSREKWLQRKYK